MKSLLFAVIVFMAIPTQTNAQTAAFTLNQLWCNRTTEQGQDEVYFIVFYRYNFIGGISGQYTTQQYNINDGNQPRSIGSFNLFQRPLYPGQSVDITVMVMEADGGGSAQIINRAQTIMEYGVPAACMGFPPSCPYATAIGGVVEFVASLPQKLQGLIQDTDDYIGSINVRLSNNNGYLEVQYYNMNRCTSSYPPNGILTANQSIFVGDGSSYVFTATVVMY
jgi:hypothetical protein